MAGRGFGKTRIASESCRKLVCGKTPLDRGLYSRIAIVAETAADARDVMVEGQSGILAVHPNDFRPIYEPSKRRLTWPNGAIGTLYNATEPDQLRGPQHDLALCDELAKWRYAQQTWDQLQFGLRIGLKPRQIITTTPRPIPLIKAIMKAATTIITRGSTYDNANNLAVSFIDTIRDRYEGTRLGRQELNAEILDDIPGALWTREMIDRARMASSDPLPDMARVVVAVDPSGTSGEEDERSDAVGIVAAGKGVNGRFYILADRTCQMAPAGWGARAVNTYHEFGADRLVAERNYGGAMVEHVIKTAGGRPVAYGEVVASRGKVVRAEPISALYEQGRVSHVGAFPELEDQMTAMTSSGYLGDRSPDRVDAMVWALTELSEGSIGAVNVSRESARAFGAGMARLGQRAAESRFRGL